MFNSNIHYDIRLHIFYTITRGKISRDYILIRKAQICYKFKFLGTSLAVHRLRFCASTTRGMGSIPGWGAKIPHAMW